MRLAVLSFVRRVGSRFVFWCTCPRLLARLDCVWVPASRHIASAPFLLVSAGQTWIRRVLLQQQCRGCVHHPWPFCFALRILLWLVRGAILVGGLVFFSVRSACLGDKPWSRACRYAMTWYFFLELENDALWVFFGLFVGAFGFDALGYVCQVLRVIMFTWDHAHILRRLTLFLRSCVVGRIVRDSLLPCGVRHRLRRLRGLGKRSTRRGGGRGSCLEGQARRSLNAVSYLRPQFTEHCIFWMVWEGRGSCGIA